MWWAILCFASASNKVNSQVWPELLSLWSTAFLIATISSACFADIAGPDDTELADLRRVIN